MVILLLPQCYWELSQWGSKRSSQSPVLSSTRWLDVDQFRLLGSAIAVNGVVSIAFDALVASAGYVSLYLKCKRLLAISLLVIPSAPIPKDACLHGSCPLFCSALNLTQLLLYPTIR
jgi:hypothetical protein